MFVKTSKTASKRDFQLNFNSGKNVLFFAYRPVTKGPIIEQLCTKTCLYVTKKTMNEEVNLRNREDRRAAALKGSDAIIG